MAAKRPAGEEGPVPPAKRPTVPLTPLHVPPATSQEDLDVKILQVQTNIGWIEGGVDPMHKSTDNYICLHSCIVSDSWMLLCCY